MRSAAPLNTMVSRRQIMTFALALDAGSPVDAACSGRRWNAHPF
jgi:hypothetical protein